MSTVLPATSLREEEAYASAAWTFSMHRSSAVKESADAKLWIMAAGKGARLEK
jgi:hypothetical protein